MTLQDQLAISREERAQRQEQQQQETAEAQRELTQTRIEDMRSRMNERMQQSGQEPITASEMMRTTELMEDLDLEVDTETGDIYDNRGWRFRKKLSTDDPKYKQLAATKGGQAIIAGLGAETQSFASPEEAEAANLAPGTEIIINGRRAIIE
jgi:hypothetical protein